MKITYPIDDVRDRFGGRFVSRLGGRLWDQILEQVRRTKRGNEMITRSKVCDTTKQILEQAKTDGKPVMFIINNTLREGWLYREHYIWESGGSAMISTEVERVVDPGRPIG